MKKIKILLAAIGVLAVAGGAMAFKAKTFGFTPIYTTSQAGTDVTCPFTAPNLYRPGGSVQIFATTTKGAKCANLLSTTVEP